MAPNASIGDIFGCTLFDELSLASYIAHRVFRPVPRITQDEDERLFQFALAPSFGRLSEPSIANMDDDLKVMIMGTTRKISQLQNRSWENVLACFSQNSLLQPGNKSENPEVYRHDHFLKDYGSSCFRINNGAPRPEVVREVFDWFNELIGDEDVLRATGIDIAVMSEIVATTGSAIESFSDIFVRDSFKEKTIFELGVLRYPDIEHPYFKLYQIKLHAYAASRQFLMNQKDVNGISGEFKCRYYEPRESVIRKLRPETVRKTVEEAEDLLNQHWS